MSLNAIPHLLSDTLAFHFSCVQFPENLLIFAAGNEGDVDDGRINCTINNPAIGKNVLAVGATSSGETRLGITGEQGEAADGTNGYADVDTVASFSSYGLTQDGRIKPEVVAPGDAVSPFDLLFPVPCLANSTYCRGYLDLRRHMDSICFSYLCEAWLFKE